MPAWLLHDLIKVAIMAGGSAAAFGLLMVPRTSRYVTRACVKFVMRHIPRWLAWVLTPVMVATPGQFDEAIITALILAWVLRKPAQRLAFRQCISDAVVRARAGRQPKPSLQSVQVQKGK